VLPVNQDGEVAQVVLLHRSEVLARRPRDEFVALGLA
jgi:hypothetical protein